MFMWSAKGRDGERVRIHVPRWNERPLGSTKSFAEHFQDGRLEFEGSRYYLVPTIRERRETGEPQYVGAFGPVAGLTTLPLAMVAHLAGVRLYEDAAATLGIAKLTAAMLVAGSVAMLYLTAVGFVSRGSALLLCLAVGLGTCLWTMSSQSLWQQTPEIFFLSLGLYCLVRIPSPWLRGAAAGLALSAAAACRPTAALVALVGAGWLLWSDRRALAAFLLAALPIAAAILAYNIYYFGSPLEFGQLVAGERVATTKTGHPDVWQTPFWLGAAGLLVSPSRGLLVFSPVLAASFIGAVIAWRDPRYRSLRFAAIAVPLLWAPAFLWFDWWGGWAYGYRPIVDSIPLLAVLCIPSVRWLLEQRVWRAAFALLLAWSVFVQVLGAFAYSPWGWNYKVIDAEGTRANVDVPAYRHRLWSLHDSQIGYLVTHFRQARAERDLQVGY